MFVFAAGIPRQHQRTSDCFENPKRSLLKPRGVASTDRALNEKDDGSDNDKEVAWEKSRHFATLAMVSPRNDVWETSAEIPFW